LKAGRTKRNRLTRGRIQTHNASHASGEGGRSIAIDIDIHDAAERASLERVPGGRLGITLPERLAEGRRRAPQRPFAGRNVNGYATTVKLELEACGLIARVPGARPRRLVRNGQSS
jgi:hypothetical protein